LLNHFLSLLSLFPSPSLRLPSVLLQLATRLPAHAVVCSLVLASSSSLSQAGRLLSSSSPGSAPFLLPIAPTDRARAAQCQPAKSVGHTSSLSDSARPSLPHPFLSSLLAYEGSSGHRCGWSSTSRGRWAPHGSCQSPCW